MLDNIKSQMRKGILEYCILEIIDKKEAYVSDIIMCLHDADLIVVEGTLYPLLTRMKNLGMLNYRWQESTEGPPRKYYMITDEGKQMLAELRHEWEHISSSINSITTKAADAVSPTNYDTDNNNQS